MIESSSLQHYSLFGGFLKEQIDKILPLVENESYEEGDNIIVEGYRNDKLRFIIDGRVAVVKQGVILSEFGEGEVFGEMEVLDIMPSVATIKALTATQVMAISNKALHDIYKADIQAFSLLIMNLARDLSRRLRKLDERVVKETPLMDWN
jgi:CRP-like cAMP-binding protein